jgi:GNAT superfamily N-acetyltransferase
MAVVQPAQWVSGLGHGQLQEAAAMLARGMRDTPMSVAIHGPHAARREAELRPVFALELERLWPTTLSVSRGGQLVGIAGVAAPGQCRRLPRADPRALRLAARQGPRSALRFARWRLAWQLREPLALHWHLGPVAADAHLRGQGIGSALLDAACSRADERGEPVYLETDTERNVRFYARWGFVVCGEATVLGQRNWFMWRPPPEPSSAHRRG